MRLESHRRKEIPIDKIIKVITGAGTVSLTHSGFRTLSFDGFAYETQGSDPLECVVSAAKSFRLRLHKGFAPSDCTDI